MSFGDCEPVLLLTRTRIGDRNFAPDIATLRAESMSLRTGHRARRRSPISETSRVFGGVSGGRADDRRCDLARPRADVVSSDPALIVYTRAARDVPKGALLPHRGLVRCCRNQMRYWRADPVRVLNFLPINHIGCVGDISSWTLVAGGCIVFLEKFDAARSMEITSSEHCTVWGGVPTTIIMCMALPDFDASTCRRCS